MAELDLNNMPQHDGNGAALGFIYSAIVLMIAEGSRALNEHLPPLIMDLCQVAAWMSTIILGFATFYFKVLKKKK